MNMLTFALGNLYRRPARSLLTIVAISLGIAAVVALTSIAWGFEASWQKANDARGTDLIVTRTASQNSMPSPFVEEKPREFIKHLPHVQAVDGLLSEMLSVGEQSQPLFVFGWAYKSYLWNHLRLLAGAWPEKDSDLSVVLGTLAADLLHKQPGDTVEIEGTVFKIVGTFESDAMVENGALLMTLSQAQSVTDKTGKVNVLNIKLDAGATEGDLNQLKATVQVALPGYVALTSGELVRNNAIVKISKAMSQATILIVSLVGALIVFNTMLMSVGERNREIGILLVLGWRRRSIITLIFSESAILALAGGISGIALGIVLTQVLEHLEVLRGKISAVLSAPFLLSVLGLAIFIGICGGLYPAFKASRLLPAQALRHE